MTTFIDKQCPFFWKESLGDSSIMNPKTRKCLVRQVKDYQEGEPGCVYRGSPPPVCFCLGEYFAVDMKKIGTNTWECSHCRKQEKGIKNAAGYLDYEPIQ